MRVEEGTDLVFIRDAPSAVLQVIHPAKTGVLEIGRDVASDNGIVDFVPQSSRFSKIANVSLESFVARHTLDAFRREHRVCFCRIHSKIIHSCSPLSMQELAK